MSMVRVTIISKIVTDWFKVVHSGKDGVFMQHIFEVVVKWIVLQIIINIPTQTFPISKSEFFCINLVIVADNGQLFRR